MTNFLAPASIAVVVTIGGVHFLGGFLDPMHTAAAEAREASAILKDCQEKAHELAQSTAGLQQGVHALSEGATAMNDDVHSQDFVDNVVGENDRPDVDEDILGARVRDFCNSHPSPSKDCVECLQHGKCHLPK